MAWELTDFIGGAALKSRDNAVQITFAAFFIQKHQGSVIAQECMAVNIQIIRDALNWTQKWLWNGFFRSRFDGDQNAVAETRYMQLQISTALV